MEQFFVITTVTNQELANQMCGTLEEAEIPVMLEHVTIDDGDELASGFRLLVPSKYTQVALNLLSQLQLAQDIRSGTVTPSRTPLAQPFQ